jgi:hypothetical protein
VWLARRARLRRVRGARVSSAVQPELKLDLATRGVRIEPSARGLTPTAEPLPQSLELILADDVRVSVPVDAAGTAPAPFLLTGGDGGGYWLLDRETNGAPRLAVRVAATPHFYGRRTAGGLPMRRVASVRGSHLLVHPAGACGFSVQGAPCRFCLEGARGRGDPEATVADVVEVVRAAFDEGAAEFVYLNSDAFDAEDGGLAFLAPYVEGIRRHFDTVVAVQVHPPRTDRWIDWAYALGVDALSFNLEIYDPQLLDRHCIGRMRYIGRQRYLDALGHAARVFPSGTVWSDLVLGVEPPASTMAGIDALAALGVVPVVSARRALSPAATALDPADVSRILSHLYRAVRERRINMSWVRDLVAGVAPLEAHRGGGAPLARAARGLARSRLGALAARGLARFRRRLRVKNVSDSFDAAHL